MPGHASVRPARVLAHMTHPLLNRRQSVVVLLGAAAGLPLALSDSTLQAWLTVGGVDVATIGVFSLVGLPYVFKFLWAPLVDRYQPGWPGRRRDWILCCQAVLAALLAWAGLADLAAGPLPWLALTALAIAAASATQDIAIDAYRTELLGEHERGFGAAVFVLGYRLGMLMAGAGALVLADRIGFATTYLCLAALTVSGMLATVLAPALPAAIPPPASLRAAVSEPLTEFFGRDSAMALVGIIVLYKLGDAFAGRLTTNFLLAGLGFSLTDVGTIYKGMGLIATLAGALYGGALMSRLGLYRSLIVFAWLQALTNLGFCLLALAGKSYLTMVAVIGLENLTGGMGTAAFVALLMAVCNARYTATQFALLTALASLARVLAGPPAGYLVDGIGWAWFFAVTFVLALPVIALLASRRAVVEQLGSTPPP